MWVMVVRVNPCPAGAGSRFGWSFPIPNERYDLGYYHEQRHFLQCVIEGKRPKVNFDDGRVTLEIALAAYKSHETGETVTLPLVQVSIGQ